MKTTCEHGCEIGNTTCESECDDRCGQSRRFIDCIDQECSRAHKLDTPCTHRAATDPIKSPSHYIGTDGLEVKEVIRQFDLGFFTGGAVKYILRAGKKGDEIEDFKKATEMLNIEIDNLNRKGSK